MSCSFVLPCCQCWGVFHLLDQFLHYPLLCRTSGSLRILRGILWNVVSYPLEQGLSIFYEWTCYVFIGCCLVVQKESDCNAWISHEDGGLFKKTSQFNSDSPRLKTNHYVDNTILLRFEQIFQIIYLRNKYSCQRLPALMRESGEASVCRRISGSPVLDEVLQMSVRTDRDTPTWTWKRVLLKGCSVRGVDAETKVTRTSTAAFKVRERYHLKPFHKVAALGSAYLWVKD